MNKDVKFPYYSGNIKLTKSLGLISLEQFINVHKRPKPRTIKILEEVKTIKDPKIKRALKHQLYSFTPSCIINKMDKRNYSNIKKYTGLMQIDLDNIDDYKTALDIKYWLFAQPECVCTYFSPSQNVKGLIKIIPPLNKEHYKRIYNSVEEKYEQTGYFDTATKNAILPLFISMDEKILYRDIEDAFTWDKEKEVVVDHVALNDIQNPNFSSSDQKYFYDKTIRILETKINFISSNGHPQVRSAALILGSRVGAGYLTESEAVNYISNLIKSNDYLKKGISGYITTAIWGIKQGINNPKYY